MIGRSSLGTRRKNTSIEKYFPWVAIFLIALWCADLTLLAIRPQFLSTNPPPPQPVKPIFERRALPSDYQTIVSRNIFNSDGIIADPVSSSGVQLPGGLDGPAVLSQLPLTLLGTIVHVNPGKSVATIEVKSGTNKVLPYFPNDDIEGLAILVKVDRKKAIFRNNQNGRLEYIEIKDDTTLSFGLRPKLAAPPEGEIAQKGNEFSLLRTDLDKYLNNLPQILQQATAVPNMVGGRIQGFRVIDIHPGSLYEKLGIKPGDVIMGVNGETIDSASKAMELYRNLKDSSGLTIQMERNGKSVTQNYSIVQ